MLKKSSCLHHIDLPRTGSYIGSADTYFGLGLCLTWVWQTASLSYGLGLTWVRQTCSLDQRLGPSGVWQTQNWPTILDSLGHDPNWV